VAEYHVVNFGCRASRADGEAIAAGLRHMGLSEAADSTVANVVVLNTCSVTADAERDARAYLRRVQRNSPEAKIVVTGCYAQRAPKEVASLPGVTAVVGNSHKSRVVEVALSAVTYVRPRTDALVPVDSLLGTGASQRPAVSIWHDSQFAHSDLAALPFASDSCQTRPNLKIQDGCGNRCSFCIIPVTRGPSRSVSQQECLCAVESFIESGGKELVLSGINLGRWGRDFSPPERFEDLVAAILERTALSRLRISSVEPMDWSSDLIALFHEYGKDTGGDGPRLARHVHLPLQSGSDAILRAMHRRYRPWHYAVKVEQIRTALPQAALGADVMIGFPDETEALFRETYEFIEQLPLTYLHIFPFSARPGTPAFQLHQTKPVHGKLVNERKTALKVLIAAKNLAFRRQFIGSELPVVTLAGGNRNFTEALSDNFVKITVCGSYPANRMLRVRVENLRMDGLFARPISAS
jgi:threonylcarbamoyladenosine tRNA methylthiotransferase MtaB